MQRGVWVQIQEKDRKTSRPRISEKNSERQWVQLWVLPLFARHRWSLCGGPLWTPLAPPKCWPETDCQIFLWGRRVYSGLTENWILGSATVVSSGQIPCIAREGEGFYRGERKVGELKETKGPWLFIVWVLARKEDESSFFHLGSAVFTAWGRSPFWSPNSTYLFIYFEKMVFMWTVFNVFIF